MVPTITQQALIDEATRRGFRYEFIGSHKPVLKITAPSGTSEIFAGSRPMSSSANGRRITVDKSLTLAFVESCGYTVPAYELIDSPEQALNFLRANDAIVIKPVDASDSAGVTANITEKSGAIVAFEAAKSISVTSSVIAQTYLQGKLYRLLVMKGRLVAVAERRAARVLGDGQSTIGQLITTLNDHPTRNIVGPFALYKVAHSNVTDYLGADSLTNIPADGEVVRLTEIESVDRGGDAINVTDKTHPSWGLAVEDIAKSVGLPLAGFDIITSDISLPMQDNYVPLLEINAAPGFKLHLFPSIGDPINPAEIALKDLA